MERGICSLGTVIRQFAVVIFVALLSNLIPTGALAVDPISPFLDDPAMVAATASAARSATDTKVRTTGHRASSPRVTSNPSSTASLRARSGERTMAPSATPVPARIGRHFEGSSSFKYDSDGAVGPRHFVEVTNLAFRIYNKYTGTLVSDARLFTTKMASLTGARLVFDQRIRFDQASNRWLVMAATNALSTESGLLFGVSKTDDPTGDWQGVYVKADPTSAFAADYPVLGFDGAAVYAVPVLVALSKDRDLNYSELFSIPKADLFAETPSAANLSRIPFDVMGYKPQTDYQSASTDGVVILQSPYPGSAGQYFESGSKRNVLNAGGPGASLSGPLQIDVDLGVISTDFNSAQPGTNETLGPVRGAVTCVRLGRYLYAVEPDYGGLVWTVRDVESNVSLQGGRIGDPDHLLMDGAIGANERGEVVIAYVRSGPNEFGSAYASVGHTAVDGTLTFDPPLLLRAGADIYDEFGAQWGGDSARFSDYSSSVSVDPQDHGRFWVSNAYISDRNNASTYVTELIVSSDVTTPPQLRNISTRMQVLNGDSVLIAGFIITGNASKKVILRAIGPSLGAAGITDALADPVLELDEPDGTVVINDNWKDTQQTEIEATTIAPSDDHESAIVATLAPGAYTAIVRGKNGATGTGLVEAYDLDSTSDSQLSNISTRGFVDLGNNIMIGGVILGGTDARVLVRAIGPELTAQGVSGALQDPALELYDKDGVSIAANDNWKDAQETEIEATTIAPTDDRESAILATLPAGSYTAIVRGANDTTGVALVEVYNISP